MNKYFLMLQAGQKFLRKIRTKIRTLKKIRAIHTKKIILISHFYYLSFSIEFLCDG